MDGVIGALGALGAAADVGLAVGLVVGPAVGLASTEDTEDTAALLRPRFEATALPKEDSSREDAMEELHDEASLWPTAARDAVTRKLTLHEDDSKERPCSCR